MIDKQRVHKHFNQHAHEYDEYAVVQGEMADQVLSLVKNRRQMKNRPAMPGGQGLEIGCGTGYLTAQIVRAFAEISWHVLDLSENMIERARQRVDNLRVIEPGPIENSANGVSWEVADAEQWSPDKHAPFTLIVSNAAFQWFTDPFGTLERYARALAPHGMLVFSTFLPGTFTELHQSFAASARRLGIEDGRHGQDFPGEQDWRTAIARAGLRCEVITQRRQPVYADVREFLDHVRKVGAGNALRADARAAFVGKQWLRTMMDEYERQYACPGGVRATYEIAYFVVFA